MQVILDDDQKTRITVTNWGQPGEKQQKMGEHVESIEFSLDIQLNFVFSTC